MTHQLFPPLRLPQGSLWPWGKDRSTETELRARVAELEKLLTLEVPGVLCYVSRGVAWFTTDSLQRQWGDDWNDAPYEHNAGTPYSREGVTLTTVRFIGGRLSEPCDGTDLNSRWSVQSINMGVTPWLSTEHGWSFGTDAPLVHIFAGVSFPEFCERLKLGGGQALMPIPDLGRT